MVKLPKALSNKRIECSITGVHSPYLRRHLKIQCNVSYCERKENLLRYCPGWISR